ncbi:hypothetical protein L1987_43121 [Smallanthus sonchifolius]|uniref:Uncharacterized protein n=1 Tax=Smallanthus sonchifolius TaxID=185202 RepID=A0ACB9GLR5_9ASTR|nr:hypothetical protein L1987_43121 [Smallanthus sonchifolius]
MGIGEVPEWVEFVIEGERPVPNNPSTDPPLNRSETETQMEEEAQSEQPTDPQTGGPGLVDPINENESSNEDGPRRSTRTSSVPQRFNDYVMLHQEECLLLNDEPYNFEEAKNNIEWQKAMQAELTSIKQNKTWQLCHLLSRSKAIGLKWVFKIKRDANGSITKYKARLVAKGYVQDPGVDFDEVFAPVARLETIRLILGLVARNKWLVYHHDIKSAFLNGELKEVVHVKQPEGYVVPVKENMVYILNKALYGLRQAPRAWNEKLDRTMKILNFTRCSKETALYRRVTKGDLIIVGIYVDDLIVTGSSQIEINKFKEQMRGEFDMQDLGILFYYLGLEVIQ